MTIAQRSADWPAWLPDDARLYLTHVQHSKAIREIARSEGRHASTILRKIRAFELRRDDPLVDEALSRFEAANTHHQDISTKEGTIPMSAPIRSARTHACTSPCGIRDRWRCTWSQAPSSQ